MAYRITDKCIQCGTCAANCPAESIALENDTYVINQDTCAQCGLCQSNCPAEAIVEE